MDSSQLIAQMLGLVYLVVAVGIAFNPDRYKKLCKEFTSSIGLGYIGGVLALLTGYLIITFGPNTWEASYEGLITLIGWMALVKGVLYIVRPEVLKDVGSWWTKNLQLATLIALVLGLALSYYGYVL